MPLIKLSCTQNLSTEVLSELSSVVAEVIAKPEQYVMVIAEQVDAGIMSGESGDVLYAEVKSIGGLNRTVNSALAARVCALCSQRLGIPATRIYMTFQSVERDHWGWNGSTFG